MPHNGAPSLHCDASIRVRTAHVADLDQLTRIETLAFASDRLSRRRLRALMTAPSARLLVAEAGSVLGYALVLMRKGSSAARLYSIAVSPGNAGRGIGAALLQAAEAEAIESGAESLRLEVRTDNAGAVRFYQRRGYSPTGRRDGYYADGMAALLFERDLRRSHPGELVAAPGVQAPGVAMTADG